MDGWMYTCITPPTIVSLDVASLFMSSLLVCTTGCASDQLKPC